MAKTSVTIDFVVGMYQSPQKKEPSMALFGGEQKYLTIAKWADNVIRSMPSDGMMLLIKKQMTINMTEFDIIKKEAK